ncbi:hypothetical protein AB9E15_11595 [Rhizobium leguminosarum]|jgi:hypothetical protein
MPKSSDENENAANGPSSVFDQMESLKKRYDILRWVAGLLVGLLIGAFTVGAYYQRALVFINDKTLPSGLIAFFNTATCPGNWARADEVRGRYVVGSDPNHLGDIGKAVGIALEPLENRPAGAHSHNSTNTVPVAGGGRDQMMGGGKGGFLDPKVESDLGLDQSKTPLKSGTNAPYIVLTACKSPS